MYPIGIANCQTAFSSRSVIAFCWKQSTEQSTGINSVFHIKQGYFGPLFMQKQSKMTFGLTLIWVFGDGKSCNPDIFAVLSNILLETFVQNSGVFLISGFLVNPL